MRKDPDYMMIVEIRDSGSAKAAFDAAMTGHGVWTTVHVTDAVGIMMRLRGLEVDTDRMLDPEIITGLINQSLVQKLCPHCSVPWLSVRDKVDPGCAARVAKYCNEETVRVRGSGCPHCNGAGIVGRLVIAEVIVPNLDFMEVFERGGKAHAKKHWVKNMGGVTKCMALIRRINDGMVDPIEGERSICALDKEWTTMGLDYGKKIPPETEEETTIEVVRGASMSGDRGYVYSDGTDAVLDGLLKDGAVHMSQIAEQHALIEDTE